MLIIISLLLLTHGCAGIFEPRQNPQPDLSLGNDVGTLPQSSDYLPAVMQAMHYYTEMMQYEQIQNEPTTTTTRKPYSTSKRTPATTKTTTTTRRTTQQTTTTKRPTTTTRRTTTKRPTVFQNTTPKPQASVVQSAAQKPHKPGVFAPEKPPYYIYFELPLKPEQNYHKPGVHQPSQINSPDPLNWQDPGFVSWFFQPKPQKFIDEINENDLKYLDIFPKKLLLEIVSEPLNLPAILDFDNVKEFRKKYDDSYYQSNRRSVPDKQMLNMNMRLQMQAQRSMLTGKKKSPKTRPYVLMVMLYDLLKREAKVRKLHQFGGYTPELLDELNSISQSTGVYQMKYLFQAMLKRKEVTDASIIKRINDIVTDLDNPKSDAYQELTSIPPLPFQP